MRLYFAAALSCALVTGCGGVSADPYELAERPPARSDHPLDNALIIDGRTMEEMVVATDLARADFVWDCMLDGGWDYDRRWLPGPSEFSEDIKPPPYAPAAEQYLAIINPPSGPVAEPNSAPPMSDDIARAQVDCMNRAQEAIDSPLDSVTAFLSNEAQEIEDAVVADPRVERARSDLATCIRNTGADAGDADSLYSIFYDRATALYLQFTSGQLTQSETVTRLTALADEDRRVHSVVEPCINELLAVQGEVRAQGEEEFLSRHGAALREKLAEGAVALTALEPFWADSSSSTP